MMLDYGFPQLLHQPYFLFVAAFSFPFVFEGIVHFLFDFG